MLTGSGRTPRCSASATSTRPSTTPSKTSATWSTDPVTGVRQEIYITGNPGKGIVAGDPDGSGPIPAQPEAIRDYEAIELSWNRRFAGNWSARIGYTYSKLEGTYSGLASSDEFGRTDPNVSRAFDSLHNAFDLNGNLTDGSLNTERPHQIDAQFIYRFGWGTTVGVNQYYGSGTPISTQWNYIGVPFFPFGRGNAGETDDLTQTDLLVTHPFKIGNFTLEASVNVLNLFDEDAVLLVDNNQFDGDLCDAADCDGSYDYFFGGGLDPSVRRRHGEPVLPEAQHGRLLRQPLPAGPDGPSRPEVPLVRAAAG